MVGPVVSHHYHQEDPSFAAALVLLGVDMAGFDVVLDILGQGDIHRSFEADTAVSAVVVDHVGVVVLRMMRGSSY